MSGKFAVLGVGRIVTNNRGVWGFVLGLPVGYALVSVFGIVLVKASGGLLPRKIRRKTAREFVEEYYEYLDERIPSDWRGRHVEFIEKLLEDIFRKAAVVGPAISTGTSYLEVMAAVESLREETEDEPTVEIIDQLWEYITVEWYMDHDEEN